jgi:hypothetical protein
MGGSRFSRDQVGGVFRNRDEGGIDMPPITSVMTEASATATLPFARPQSLGSSTA